MNRKLFFLVAVVCLCGGGGGGVANAQLYLHIYPSQDNNNQTIWIFSGSSTTTANNSIRTGSGSNTYADQDSWQISTSDNNGNIFDANKPSDTNFQLSPLFSSSSNPTDIASVRARIPGGGRTNITFAATATNTPSIPSVNRTISHLFLDEDSGGADDMGIRVSGSAALSYISGASFSWVGSGIINKPIGDFFAGTFRANASSPVFTASSEGSIRVVVNSQVIPEPEEYALIFGLFALGFVFFHRQQQKKKRRQTLEL